MSHVKRTCLQGLQSIGINWIKEGYKGKDIKLKEGKLLYYVVKTKAKVRSVVTMHVTNIYI